MLAVSDTTRMRDWTGQQSLAALNAHFALSRENHTRRLMFLFRVLPAVLLLISALRAANIPISLAGATQTQIVIRYTPTSTGSCSIAVTDNNGGTNPPLDIDATLFPNSHS